MPRKKNRFYHTECRLELTLRSHEDVDRLLLLPLVSLIFSPLDPAVFFAAVQFAAVEVATSRRSMIGRRGHKVTRQAWLFLYPCKTTHGDFYWFSVIRLALVTNTPRLKQSSPSMHHARPLLKRKHPTNKQDLPFTKT